MKTLALALIILCGVPSVAPGAEVVRSDLGLFTPASWQSSGSIFNLFDWTGVLSTPGDFNPDSTFDLDLPTLGDGLSWDTTHFTIPGGTTDSGDSATNDDDLGPDVIFWTSVIKDEDKDHMDDEWETENDLDPTDPTDAKADIDKDGLTNRQEFEFGSDPKVADTDEGGASDFSEWVLNTAVRKVADALFGSDEPGGVLPGDGAGVISGGVTGPIGGSFGLSSTQTIFDHSGFDFIQTGAPPPEKVTTSVSAGTPTTISGIPVTSETISTVKAIIIDLLDILPDIEKEGYDPTSDLDDEGAQDVIKRLKVAGLWLPLTGLTTGKLSLSDVLNLLFGVVTTNMTNFNNASGTNSESGAPAGASGNTGASSSSSSGRSGGGGLTGSVATPAKNNGSRAGSGGNTGGSNGAGGGSSGHSSNGSGGSSSSGGTIYTRVYVPGTTSQGSSGSSSHASHSGSDQSGHRDSGGGSGHSVRTGKKLSTPPDFKPVASEPVSGGGTGWWFMGILSALGFVARRSLMGMIG